MVFFFKRKTAYEVRISDWSSDGCYSDLGRQRRFGVPQFGAVDALAAAGLAYQRRGGRRGLTGIGDQHRAIGAVVGDARDRARQRALGAAVGFEAHDLTAGIFDRAQERGRGALAVQAERDQPGLLRHPALLPVIYDAIARLRWGIADKLTAAPCHQTRTEEASPPNPAI